MRTTAKSRYISTKSKLCMYSAIILLVCEGELSNNARIYDAC